MVHLKITSNETKQSTVTWENSSLKIWWYISTNSRCLCQCKIQLLLKRAWQFTYLFEEINSASVVHARSENHKEIIDQHWPEIQVELQWFIVQFNISHFADDVFEQRLFPCHCRVSHHRLYSIVILLVFLVQKHQLWPQVSLFCCAKNLINKETKNKTP